MSMFEKKCDNKKEENSFQKEVIEISTKQASSLISCLLVLFFITFIAGYYWGKKKNIIELQEVFDQEAVADKIVYGLALQNQQDILELDSK